MTKTKNSPESEGLTPVRTGARRVQSPTSGTITTSKQLAEALGP